ncbi:Lupus La [Paramuricea clavata]|uniref:Lupus La n=1 Tax=Paramuricea clavata TaxID=317549 RepID=A0A6S7K9G7_PARCT|nr:Lupus La [Paramuricea clavata]
MECLLTFARLKTIVHGIIGNALREHGSGLIEVDETNTKLRRAKPMPEINDEYNMLSKEKTIHCVSNLACHPIFFIDYIYL